MGRDPGDLQRSLVFRGKVNGAGFARYGLAKIVERLAGCFRQLHGEGVRRSLRKEFAGVLVNAEQPDAVGIEAEDQMRENLADDAGHVALFVELARKLVQLGGFAKGLF